MANVESVLSVGGFLEGTWCVSVWPPPFILFPLYPNKASPKLLVSTLGSAQIMEVMEEEASTEDGLVLEMHLDMPPSLRGVADLDLRVH